MNDKTPDNCPKCGAEKRGEPRVLGGVQWTEYECGYVIYADGTTAFTIRSQTGNVAEALHDKLAVEREARKMTETENRLLRQFIECLQCGSILLDTELDAWLSVPFD